MIDALDALLALEELRTMSAVAVRLHLTQSAVSKRLAALENSVGSKLTERHGRHVRLTPEALRLVQETRPLLSQLKDSLKIVRLVGNGTLRLAVSDSVMSSWGAAALRDVAKEMPGLTLQLHVHRSVLAVELVRSGDCQLALCADPATATELSSEDVTREPMVIIPPGLKVPKKRQSGPLPVITIAPNAATWAIIKDQLHRHEGSPGKVHVTRTVESFAAVAQMAIAGFGFGLLPLGVARAFRIRNNGLMWFRPNIFRQISLVGGSTTFGRPVVRQFLEELRRSPSLKSLARP